MTLKEIFQEAVKNKASDVHIIVGKPPIFRINGELKAIKNAPDVNEKKAEELIFGLLNPQQKERFLKEKELDISAQLPDNNRLRVNCHLEKGNIGLVARLIPAVLPTMEEILMPPIAYDLARRKQGLVLLTGPTGCGKSTSLAAMINLINNERSVHIVTLEDPIEFIFHPVKSIIKQRQIGTDTVSFAEGLKHVVRQDPNVIMVGEMRDLETISTTLTLAETGHLVLATLHTNSSSQAIDRIIDVFPPYQQVQIRLQLSLVLNGIIAQQLLPKTDGGRIAAREILINTAAVANLIRDQKTAQIRSILQTSSSQGMFTMDQDLEKLIDQNLVTKEMASMYMLDGKS
ncbi:MAG TPA: PilT/PilU family type 4a pilus ATPase [bacterium]|nr:PilT/PilU family type 4a pilus ATPase [bacterium]HPL95551.1 PilT/PilU family type 4a pilus ATPase [bacterium]